VRFVAEKTTVGLDEAASEGRGLADDRAVEPEVVRSWLVTLEGSGAEVVVSACRLAAPPGPQGALLFVSGDRVEAAFAAGEWAWAVAAPTLDWESGGIGGGVE
jgi:hypothetical protein